MDKYDAFYLRLVYWAQYSTITILFFYSAYIAFYCECDDVSADSSHSHVSADMFENVARALAFLSRECGERAAICEKRKSPERQREKSTFLFLTTALTFLRM